MTASAEVEVLAWFERALDQPVSERLAWLRAQTLPGWLHQRVQRLVESESSLGEFLEGAAPLPEPPEFPRIGERVGSYALLKELDAGGMGVVFLARRADEAYDQQVAIKLIRPLHLGAGPALRRQLIARFENERALLARLSHPNIARILDGGSTASGIPYLVMEYVDGVALIDYCEREALDVVGRVKLFRKVCDGVQEAHRHLIVHRDLKPENILVGADGEPRLLDFGIARALEDVGDQAGTATVLTAMTPAYASPEQVRREPLSTGSDVYSLGVVLYQLLAGSRPYELATLTPAQAERVVCETEPEPLRTVLKRAPLPERERVRRQAQLAPDLDRIVAKALHKEVARRYTSAQELADELQRYLDGKPVRAHPDSAAYRIGKFVGRHRIGSAAATLSLAAIIGAAGVAFWQARAAQRSADDMGQINVFLLDVLKQSSPYETGSELTLSQALDNAVGMIDERFAGRPDLSAEIRFGIGYSMIDRNKLDAAEPQLLKALDESRVAFGPDDIRTLRVVEALAGLRHEQSRIDEAVALYKQGIASIEASDQQRDPLYIDLLGNLGMLYLTLDRYADADLWVQRALKAMPVPTPPSMAQDRANLLTNLAQVAHGLDDLSRADDLYRQAQEANETLFPDGSPDLATVIYNRALLAEDRDDLAAALALHQKSLAIRRKVFKGEHPKIVTAITSVARLLIATNDNAAALTTAQEAVAMADRVYTEPNNRHASTYGTLADARSANGDLKGAAEALRHAHDLLAKVDQSTPVTGVYLEKVRKKLCAKPDAPPAACPAEPTATN